MNDCVSQSVSQSVTYRDATPYPSCMNVKADYINMLLYKRSGMSSLRRKTYLDILSLERERRENIKKMKVLSSLLHWLFHESPIFLVSPHSR